VNTLRTLALAGPAAGLVTLLAATPADAAFSTAASLTRMGIATTAVQAPTGLTGSITCGRTSSTLNLNWTASGTAGVTGYVVRIVFSDGYEQSTAAQPGTSWSGTVDTYYATTTTLHMTATTQTSYGWTRESAPTAELSC
jgi:hypothetical protein